MSSELTAEQKERKIKVNEFCDMLVIVFGRIGFGDFFGNFII